MQYENEGLFRAFTVWIGFKLCMTLVGKELTTCFTSNDLKAQSHSRHHEMVSLLWSFNKEWLRKVTRDHAIHNITSLWVVAYSQRTTIDLQTATEITIPG